MAGVTGMVDILTVGRCEHALRIHTAAFLHVAFAAGHVAAVLLAHHMVAGKTADALMRGVVKGDIEKLGFLSFHGYRGFNHIVERMAGPAVGKSNTIFARRLRAETRVAGIAGMLGVFCMECREQTQFFRTSSQLIVTGRTGNIAVVFVCLHVVTGNTVDAAVRTVVEGDGEEL